MKIEYRRQDLTDSEYQNYQVGDQWNKNYQVIRRSEKKQWLIIAPLNRRTGKPRKTDWMVYDHRDGSLFEY